VALVFLAASSLQAQREPSAQRDPSDARVVVPRVIHTSIPLVRADTADDRRIPWKDANDEVRCIGGWRVYARESRQTPSLTGVATANAPQANTAPKACSDHRDARGLEREGRNDAR
jgi:hypothetical protein